MNTPSGRAWEQKMPPAMNGMMTTILRLPVLHRLMSREIMLLTFTGRKSGKRYTTPIGYLREGSKVTLLTKRFHSWWHNFEPSAPVEMHIAGQTLHGTAKAITDEAVLGPLVTKLTTGRPRQGQAFDITYNTAGLPNPEDIARITPKVVVIEVTLN